MVRICALRVLYFVSFHRFLTAFADVINVSGHRLSTAEIESALIMHKGVAETAGTFYYLFVLSTFTISV